MTRTINAELVLEAGAHRGEGPVWHPTEQTLDWVDIMAGHLHRYDARTDRDEVIDVGRPIGAYAPRRSEGYVLALERGFGVLEPSGEVRVVASIEIPGPSQRMNDGKCDSAGRFWAGTMYYIDSLAHGIDAFDFDTRTGAISGRRRLIGIPPDRTARTGEAVPDGMTLDTEGYLWVAIHGASEVRRYSPRGEVECIVRLPVCAVTSCAFGGEELTDLYMTSMVVFDDGREPLAGALFRCTPRSSGAAGSLV